MSLVLFDTARGWINKQAASGEGSAAEAFGGGGGGGRAGGGGAGAEWGLEALARCASSFALALAGSALAGLVLTAAFAHGLKRSRLKEYPQLEQVRSTGCWSRLSLPPLFLS